MRAFTGCLLIMGLLVSCDAPDETNDSGGGGVASFFRELEEEKRRASYRAEIMQLFSDEGLSHREGLELSVRCSVVAFNLIPGNLRPRGGDLDDPYSNAEKINSIAWDSIVILSNELQVDPLEEEVRNIRRQAEIDFFSPSIAQVLAEEELPMHIQEQYDKCDSFFVRDANR